MDGMTYYQQLQVSSTATFQDLKRAYYRRAKACHPDRFQGDKGKEAEFKQLVHAFGVLSDPEQRQQYDAFLALHQHTSFNGTAQAPVIQHRQTGVSGAIMDSIADDILEELIVGNAIPIMTSLESIFLDLQQTEQFMQFREGKYAYASGRYQTARRMFQKTVNTSPGNILYHFYLALAAEAIGRHRQATRHYRQCLVLGRYRQPPQQLFTVQHRLQGLRYHRQQGWLGRLMSWLRPPPPAPQLSAEEQLHQDTTRSMTRLLHEQSRADKKRRLLR